MRRGCRRLRKEAWRRVGWCRECRFQSGHTRWRGNANVLRHSRQRLGRRQRGNPRLPKVACIPSRNQVGGARGGRTNLHRILEVLQWKAQRTATRTSALRLRRSPDGDLPRSTGTRDAARPRVALGAWQQIAVDGDGQSDLYRRLSSWCIRTLTGAFVPSLMLSIDPALPSFRRPDSSLRVNRSSAAGGQRLERLSHSVTCVAPSA